MGHGVQPLEVPSYSDDRVQEANKCNIQTPWSGPGILSSAPDILGLTSQVT